MPLTSGGASPQQMTDNTWMVLFGVASVKVILPQTKTMGDFTFWISLSLSLFAQSKD